MKNTKRKQSKKLKNVNNTYDTSGIEIECGVIGVKKCKGITNWDIIIAFGELINGKSFRLSDFNELNHDHDDEKKFSPNFIQIETWRQKSSFKKFEQGNHDVVMDTQQHRGLKKDDIITVNVSRQGVSNCSFWVFGEKKFSTTLCMERFDYLFALSCEKCTCHRGSAVFRSGFQFQLSLQ